MLTVARPLTRPLIWGNNSRRSRHRLGLYAATAAHARALVVAARTGPERAAGAATASRAPARTATLLTGLAPGKRAPSLREPLAEADDAIMRALPGARGVRSPDPVLHPLMHLHDVLAELGAPPADLAAHTASTVVRQAVGGTDRIFRHARASTCVVR